MCLAALLCQQSSRMEVQRYRQQFSRMEVQRYRHMDNRYHSHSRNLVSCMLYLNVTIKNLFVKTREAPFDNTNTVSGGTTV